jgi:TRAP-type C4-dicarboxylate transport system permease small subunit
MIAVMMLWTVSDVFLRYFFRAPIPGSAELAELMLVCTGFLTLAWCTLSEEHIKVDLVLSRFSPRVQIITDIITLTAGLAVCVIITWRSFVDSMAVRQLNLVSSILRVPDFPFHLVVVLGYAVFSLAIATILIQKVARIVKW